MIWVREWGNKTPVSKQVASCCNHLYNGKKISSIRHKCM